MSRLVARLTRRSRGLEQAALLGSLALILGWVTWPLVRGYRLHGDDFAPVFHSGAPYFRIGEWTTWFTQGWSSYFVNYEGWQPLGTDFVRPVVNLGLYLQSLLAPTLGDPAYLLGNYLALAGTVLLVNLVLRRYTDAGIEIRLLASLAVGLSPVWYPNLNEASFATNAYACLFAVASIAVLDLRRGVPRGWRLWSGIGLQVLAVWSHETAIVIPLVSVALVFAFARERPTVRQLLPFSVPVLTLALSRMLVSGEGGLYALQPVPLISAAKLLVAYLFGPPIPFELTRVGEILGSGDAAVVFAYGLAMLANLALIAAVVASLPARPSGVRFWALIAVFGLSRLPGALVRMEPRFLGIALVVALVVFLALTERGGGRRWRRSVLLLLVASQAGLIYAEVVIPREHTVAMMQRAGAYFDSIERGIAEANPDDVVLVNDDVAFYATAAMIEMAAWPRTDVRPVVINSLEGGPNPAARMTLSESDGQLRVEVALGESQNAFFAGAAPDFRVSANGFTYTDVERLPGPHARAFSAIGRIEPGRTLILGVDPRDGSFLEPTLH